MHPVELIVRRKNASAAARPLLLVLVIIPVLLIFQLAGLQVIAHVRTRSAEEAATGTRGRSRWRCPMRPRASSCTPASHTAHRCSWLLDLMVLQIVPIE